MVEVASDAICLLRNPDGDIVGMSASMPIHEGTLPYLLQSPVSAPYLRTLASEQLQSLRTAPDRPAGRFIYAIDAIDLERRELRSDIVHLVFDHILAGSLLIEVPPALPYYVDSRNSMGYTEIAARNPYIYGDGTPAVTYVLDTRGPKLGIWFDQVAGAGMKAAVSPTSNASEQSGISDWNRELPRRKLPELTPREQEVAELLAQGATNREIAGKLYISEAGVKKHVNGMLQKTGLKNRTQFVAALLETKK